MTPSQETEQKFLRIFELQKKKLGPFLLCLIFGLLLAGLLYPSQSFAQEGILSNIPILGGILNSVGKAFGTAIAITIIGILSGLLSAAAIVLEWAIDPWFVKYSYTKVEGIIAIGWPVVRDLANMLLVLVLIGIALGTALRISEYQVKKALPRFVAVAILIYFTPVIMGFFVDAANIVMNFFLEGFVGASAFKNAFTTFYNGMSTKNIFTMAFWLELMMIGVFSLIATILFFTYAALFVLRRVAMWILVILSPVALVAWIFPATRGFFNTWRNQFVQWTIIGIPAAFFLWLGNQMIALAGQADFAADTGGVVGFLQETFNQVAAYGVALFFLIFGFFMTLQTSAMGASGIIKGGQTAARLVGTRYARAWGRRARQVTRATGRAARRWGREIGTRAAAGWRAGEGIGRFGRAVVGGWGGVTHPLYVGVGGRRFMTGWRVGGPAGAIREWGRGVRAAPGNLWRTITPAARAYVPRAARGFAQAARDVGRQTWNAILVGYGLRPERRGPRTCEGCGERLRENWDHCPRCGREQPPRIVCPACGRADSPRGASHCVRCGAPL